MPAGCALDENGVALSGMGVGVGDYDADGWLDIVRDELLRAGDHAVPELRRRVRGRQHSARASASTGSMSASAWTSSTSTTTAGRTSSSRTATCTRSSPAGSCTSHTGSRRCSTAIWATGVSKTCPPKAGAGDPGREPRPRLRLRGFRQRRRRGCDREQPRRSAHAAAQRRRKQEQLDPDQMRGHALEPIGDRDARESHDRRAQPDRRGHERVELLFAERFPPPLRIGRRNQGGHRRARLAVRREGDVQGPARQSPHVIQETKGIVSSRRFE